MRARQVHCVVALALLLPGCASSLKVQVDLLDPLYADTKQRQLEDATLAAALIDGNHGPRRAEVERLVTLGLAVKKLCDASMIAYLQQMQSSQPSELRAESANAIKLLQGYDTAEGRARSASGLRQEYEARLAPLDADARNLLLSDPSAIRWIKDPQLEMPSTAAIALASRSAGYQSVATDTDIVRCAAPVDYAQNTGIRLQASSATAGAASQAATAAQAKVLPKAASTLSEGAKDAGTLMGPGGISLIHDRNAYFVASAPAEKWKEKFNEAFAKTKGGSSDIIIKQEDTALFTVKGFTFDATQTAAMVNKVAVGMVGLVAGYFGADLGISGTKPDAAVIQGPNTVGAAEIAVATEEKRMELYRKHLRSLAGHVMANREALLSSDDNTRVAAEQSLRTLVSATRDVWSTGGSSAPAPQTTETGGE